MRQRRRAERGQFSQLRSRTEPAVSRRAVETKQRQLLLIGAGFVLLVIVGLLAYGWVTSSYLPPRKTVTTVLGSPIKLAELVPYTALDSIELGGALQPRTSFNNLIRDRVVRHYAGELGVEVTDEEIDQAIVDRFEPIPPDASETPDTLSEQGRTALNQTLDVFGITESEYRTWLRGRLYITEMIDDFRAEMPEEISQVHVEWIVTATQADAQAALDRVNAGEDFLEVATEVNEETGLSEEGVVGWVPEGALPALDTALFGEEMEVGEIQGPISTSFGSVLVRVTEGPEVQEVNDTMRDLVVGNQMQEWLDEKLVTADVGEVDLTTSDINWVIEQII